MSAVNSSRRWASILMLGVLAGLTVTGLVGCGGEEEVDPYVYASLRAVTRGDTLSDNFLFEIDTPQFEFVRGNTGIVRDGNLLEFVVGTDLEQNYRSYNGALLGVQKFFSPVTYLMIKRVKRAGVVTPVDSCTSYVVPRILRGAAVDLELPGAPLPDLVYNKKTEIEGYLPEEDDSGNLTPKQVQSAFQSIVYRPRHDAPDSVQMNPTEEAMVWYAVGAESAFELVDLTPGAEYMLHLLVEKDLPLVGAFEMTEMTESWPERRATYEGFGEEPVHVLGNLRVVWFRYANAYVAGNPNI
jgi:hypothetical protein